MAVLFTYDLTAPPPPHTHTHACETAEREKKTIKLSSSALRKSEMRKTRHFGKDEGKR